MRRKYDPSGVVRYSRGGNREWEGRLAIFYAREAERLKDDINAKWRYEKRVAEQEVERRRVAARAAEVKAQEEARRAEIQRLKDESLKSGWNCRHSMQV